MYCNQCAAYTCIHTMQGIGMAAQQGGIASMGLAQHLAYLQQNQSQFMNEEIKKTYTPKVNKKLLLLRK